MAGKRDRAIDGRVHRGGLKIESARLRAIEHGPDDSVNPPDFASHAFEQFAFGIIRTAPLNQYVNGPLNTGKGVLNFMSQAGGQFPKTRSMLATIYFAFVRHSLCDVAHHHQVSDDLSRIVAHRRNSRTKAPSWMFAADLFVFGAAVLVAHRASAELRKGPGLARAAEDRGHSAILRSLGERRDRPRRIRRDQRQTSRTAPSFSSFAGARRFGKDHRLLDGGARHHRDCGARTRNKSSPTCCAFWGTGRQPGS